MVFASFATVLVAGSIFKASSIQVVPLLQHSEVGAAVVPDAKHVVGQHVDINLDIPQINLPEDLKYLMCTLTRPSGKEEPLECGLGPDATLAVSFTPVEPGKHVINVKMSGKSVSDPFEIIVDEDEPGAGDGSPFVEREFDDVDINLDIPQINLPEDLKYLMCTLTRPSGKEEPLECGLGPDATLAVSFTPVEPGKHVINVKMSGKSVSEFEVDVAA
eukprot:TRINITY_DN3756_c0_g1_i2.p1 TRINITY_DN3756_c0_g1~~TRINITY_DN3756_c0_g1_i2.p1  ORF type:complete len:240 (+),score=39.85 TRINITY_DN3756_c0_g1_i2:70-720(+)